MTDSLEELSVDADSNAVPDHLGQPVVVSGRVGLSMQEDGAAGTLLLEQCGRSIPLRHNVTGLSAGDTVTVDAVLAQADGEHVLEVSRFEALHDAAVLGRVCDEPATAAAQITAAPHGLAARVLHHLPSLAWLKSAALAFAGLVLAGGVLFMAVRLWRKRSRPLFWEFSALFAQAPDAMLLTDEHLTVVAANDAARGLFARIGSSPDGQSLSDLVTASGNRKLNELLDGEEPGVVTAAVRLVPSGETGGDYTLRASRVRTGRNARLVVTLAESSDRGDREELMKRLYQVILQETPIDVAVLSPQGQYLFTSRGMTDHPALRKAIIGKTDVELCKELGLHNEVALRRRAYRRRTVSTGETVKFDEVLSLHNGERHYTRYYHPVLNQRGEVCMVVSYAIDVTELKEARAENVSLVEEVNKLRRVKETVLQNLSHEFRTPLTGIMGAIQLLQYEVSDDHRELVQIAERNGSRLLKTLNDMLDLADLQAEDIQITPTIVNVVEEMKSVVRGLQSEAEGKGLYLRLNASQNEIWSRVDAACFYRAMRHLVDNAIKFTESGGILVEMEADEEQVHIHVMDSGVGIGSSQMDRLYEPFHQESAGLSRAFEGMGVGLSITERLVNLMHGSISVQSEKDGGTMFSVVFPRVLMRSMGQDESRPSILIAERDTDEQRLFRYMLEPFSDVWFVFDLDRVVDFVSGGQCDAVILNLDGGLEQADQWIRRIRQHSGGQRIPLIGVHAFGQPGDRERYLALGLSDYLVRPIDKKHLLNALETLTAQEAVR